MKLCAIAATKSSTALDPFKVNTVENLQGTASCLIRASPCFSEPGASSAEGAPTQAGLFKAYFEYARTLPDLYGYQIGINRELATFFETFFSIDVDDGDLGKLRFPTFEEVLGILELAISRDESFVGYDNSSMFEQGSRIRSACGALILLIALILDHALEQSNNLHSRLVHKLVERQIIRHFAFLSFNYDILVDNALIAFVHSR